VDAGDAPAVASKTGLTGQGRPRRRRAWPQRGLEGDLKADALEPPREALRRAFGIAPVVDIAACFPVYAAVANDVVSQHQNAMGDGYRGLFHSRVGGDAAKQFFCRVAP